MITDIIAIPLILGAVQAIKKVGVSSKFAPVISLVLGVALSLGFNGLTKEAGLQGIIWGFSAAGLWSGARATAQGVKDELSA